MKGARRWIGLAVLVWLSLSCEGTITTEALPEEGYFPLRAGNQWTYDVTVGDEIGSETWTIVEEKAIRLGDEIATGYVIEKAGAIERSTETVIVREGGVYSVGSSGSGTRSTFYRWPKDVVPDSARGIFSAELPQETDLTVESVPSVTIGDLAGRGQTSVSYSDCLVLTGETEGVALSSQTLCRGVGLVRDSLTDVGSGALRSRVLVFFELRR